MTGIKRALTKLWDFKGRDRRAQFWPYAGVVAATTAVLSVVAAVPIILTQIQQSLVFAEANPDKATIHRTPTSVMVEIHDTTGMPPMDPVAGLWPVILLGVIAGLFLAAAITRRLHDRGLSGRWALIPAGLYAVWLTVFFRFFGSVWSDNAAIVEARFVILFMALLLTSMLVQLSIITLVIVLALKGRDGPNRYGPEPG